MRIIKMLFLSLLLSACTGSPNTTYTNPIVSPEKWQGKTVAELTAKLGPPGMTNLASNGNTEYIYNSVGTAPYSSSFDTRAATVVAPNGATIGVTSPAATVAPSGPVLINCVVIYEATPAGVIVSVRKRGKDC